MSKFLAPLGHRTRSCGFLNRSSPTALYAAGTRNSLPSASRNAALASTPFAPTAFPPVKKGANEEQISSVSDFESGPYSAKEKLGFRLADKLHKRRPCH